MLEETGIPTNLIDIHVPLLNEGTDVVRLTKGVLVEGAKYKVLPTSEYSPHLEEWEFPPGSIVECCIEKREGKQVLVARKLATH